MVETPSRYLGWKTKRYEELKIFPNGKKYRDLINDFILSKVRSKHDINRMFSSF